VGEAAVSHVLVLDSEAMSALGGHASKRREDVRAAIKTAIAHQRRVVVPAVILAELYRGAGHCQAVDACLSRETGLRIRDTDRSLARLVGGVLSGAKVGSEHIADAHVIAAAVEAGGGVVLTGDEDDLSMLAVPYPNVTVSALP
jgi:predicted nucleic acid-binding protein